MFKTAATLSVILAASAVPALAKSGDTINRVLYSCAGNETLDVVYVNTAGGSSYAVISEVNELIPLKIGKSASGANYKAVDKNYNYELQTKGNSADLYAGKERVKADCNASR